MTVLRSLVFLALQVTWTSVLAVLYLPLLVLPRGILRAGARLWCAGIIWLARVVCGIRYRVVGREHVPAGACIVAAKHQSAWDTYFFHGILGDPVYVMKKELMAIPLVGWYMRRAGSVVIDRSARVQALHMLVAGATRALGQGAQVIVFPEGTRVAPGETRPYHAGVALLYARCGVPVVPVALNSGRLWSRNAFLKHPGTVTVRILPPIPPGLPRKAFMERLRADIETACAEMSEDT